MPPTDDTQRGPADILVRLYDLPPLDLTRTEAAGVSIRRPLAPEKHVIAGRVGEHFGAPSVSETERAFSHHPISYFIATRDIVLLGFACYDVTAMGVFGPTGVAEEARGQGIGADLFMATLHAMRDHGCAYAIVGGRTHRLLPAPRGRRGHPRLVAGDVSLHAGLGARDGDLSVFPAAPPFGCPGRSTAH